jgi:chromosome partitioning protein
MKIIACYSNKGGVGKTATAVNLAHALATSGRRTLLCDLDPQGASGFYFRVKPSRKLGEARFFKDEDRLAGAIRGSDFENLDILPANLAFRNFDVFLSQMKQSRSRLKKALSAVGAEYEAILLDCPPSISTLSENVFRTADAIVVPVIPTTLSQRTFQQLVSFFADNDLPAARLHGLSRAPRSCMPRRCRRCAPTIRAASLQPGSPLRRTWSGWALPARRLPPRYRAAPPPVPIAPCAKKLLSVSAWVQEPGLPDPAAAGTPRLIRRGATAASRAARAPAPP